MANELRIFENPEFGRVRTVTINNEPYFVGKDIADALGYKNTKDALAKHVAIEDKQIFKGSDLRPLENHIPKDVFSIDFVNADIPNRGLTIINESGVYALIFGSKLESAKRFKHWVTSEVLPSIRKNGGYIAGQESLTDEELLAKAVMVAQKKIAERDAIIESQRQRLESAKPKIIFCDAVSASKNSILVGELAKLICQNGVKIGQNRLFAWLRDNGYLLKCGSSYNMPAQRYVEQGLFEIKESNIQNPDGSVRITATTKVTGSGQVYFINKFISMSQSGGI